MRRISINTHLNKTDSGEKNGNHEASARRARLSLGRRAIKKEFGKTLPLTPLAETWECSVHPDGLSRIGNGKFQGKTLADVLKEHPEYMGSKMEAESELPILVKFIDAKQDLSVQVHPDDDYARKHEYQNGKTEMWYIVDAEDDASLIYGFAHPVTKEILNRAIEKRHLENIYKK